MIHRRLFFIMTTLLIVSVASLCLYQPLLKAISYLWSHAHKRLYTYKAFQYQFNNIFSEEVKRDIEEYVSREFANGNLLRFDSGDFYSDIRNRYPLIASVTLRRIPTKKLLITIEGVLPMFMINNRLIIADNKQLYDAAYFSSFPLHKLPLVEVPIELNSLQITKELYPLLCALDKSFWEAYTIEYHNPYKIKIKTKNDATTTIVTDHHSLFDAKKFEHIDAIKKHLKQQKKLLTHRIYHTTIDLRFYKRIIAHVTDYGKGGRLK